MLLVNKTELINLLPPYENKRVLLKQDQDIDDIVKEVVQAHRFFAADYDCIYSFFDAGDCKDMASNLFDFCKRNIRYDIEREGKQSTKSPGAILTQGHGDCKHYAGFIGGVLDAIKRNEGRKVNWFYRFASYDLLDNKPEHVFVVIVCDGKEYWIDPVLPSFNSRKEVPFSYIDKKVNMALYRISGIGATNLNDSVNELLSLGIIDRNGKTNVAKLASVFNNLSPQDQSDLTNTYAHFLYAQRQAYLNLVRNNANRYADVIKRLVYNLDGSLNQQNYNDIYTIWVDQLGGNISDLMEAAKTGGGKVSGFGRIGDIISEIGTSATSVINAFNGLFNAKTAAAAQIDKDQTAVELAALQAAQQQQSNPFAMLSPYIPYIAIGLIAYFIIKK